VNTYIGISITLKEDVTERKDVDINAEFCGLREDNRKTIFSSLTTDLEGNVYNSASEETYSSRFLHVSRRLARFYKGVLLVMMT
jgi:hypothetical protein